MKLKTYEKFVWIIEPGAMYHLEVKGYFLVHPESAHWVYHKLHLVVQLMKDCFQTNPVQGTKLKHMAMQLNTSLNFLQKVEPDVIWLRG